MKAPLLLINILAVTLLSGCASVLQDKMQQVKVETLTTDGDSVVGAKCELTNTRGTFYTETPKAAMVRKSADEVIITCTTTDNQIADGKLISRVGGAVFGNILLGGGIGAIVDTSTGVAYNYPEWVKLIIGQTLVFDRNDHKDGQPNPPSKETAGAQPVSQETTVDAKLEK